MSLNSQHLWKPCLLGVVVALAAVETSFAGWMGFRNDTKDPIVIQETTIVNGQPKPGRAQRLAPGEAVRDAQFVGGKRRFSVYDPKNPNVPIFSDNFTCPALNENILYSLKSDGNGSIKVDTVKSAAGGGNPKK